MLEPDNTLVRNESFYFILTLNDMSPFMVLKFYSERMDVVTLTILLFTLKMMFLYMCMTHVMIYVIYKNVFNFMVLFDASHFNKC